MYKHRKNPSKPYKPGYAGSHGPLHGPLSPAECASYRKRFTVYLGKSEFAPGEGFYFWGDPESGHVISVGSPGRNTTGFGPVGYWRNFVSLPHREDVTITAAGKAWGRKSNPTIAPGIRTPTMRDLSAVYSKPEAVTERAARPVLNAIKRELRGEQDLPHGQGVWSVPLDRAGYPMRGGYAYDQTLAPGGVPRFGARQITAAYVLARKQGANIALTDALERAIAKVPAKGYRKNAGKHTPKIGDWVKSPDGRYGHVITDIPSIVVDAFKPVGGGRYVWNDMQRLTPAQVDALTVVQKVPSGVQRAVQEHYNDEMTKHSGGQRKNPWSSDLMADNFYNPGARKYTLESFSKAYWGPKWQEVPASTLREFWSDFRFAHNGSLKSYKAATSRSA